MSDDHQQPYDGLTRWLGEGDDEPSAPGPPDEHRSRSPRVVVRLVALALPWLVTLAVLVVSAAGRAPAPPTVSAGDDGTPPAVAAASPPTAGGGAVPGAAPSDGTRLPDAVPGDGRAADATGGAPPPDDVAAVAVAAVRDAVTGRAGGAFRALDVAAAEAPRELGADHWLVRVRAVVLRGDERRWHSAAHEVWAVPVTRQRGAPVAADRPWRVAHGRRRPRPIAWRPARGDHAAVAAALRHAGLRPAADLDAQRHPDLPAVVRVRTAGGGRVWVHTAPAPRVLGADADRAPAGRAS